MVLLPDPDGPTIAVEVPTLILNEEPSNTFLASAGILGYLN